MKKEAIVEVEKQSSWKNNYGLKKKEAKLYSVEMHCTASFYFMDFSLLTTSEVSQKRNGAVGNKKPPAMRVEDKLLYKKITFPL